MGGHADWIQGLQADRKDVLLLQLSGDDDAGMNWSLHIYWLFTPAEIRACRFKKKGMCVMQDS
jgi:hypothetical protein